MLKAYLTNLFISAMDKNKRNILKLVEGAHADSFLDLGCDNGDWTVQVAQAAGAQKISGVELVVERAKVAEQKGISVTVADLGQKLPLENGSFDLIHANQVIEHAPDIDLFASEAMRILKPGGQIVVSTENGSSWHNVFAAALGWQMFSLTNLSHLKSGIGNPLALHRNEPIELKTWTHKVIFNYRGLAEFFEAHGYVDLKIMGAGYYPLPSWVGGLDPRHSHFITIRGKKPKPN